MQAFLVCNGHVYIGFWIQPIFSNWRPLLVSIFNKYINFIPGVCSWFLNLNHYPGNSLDFSMLLAFHTKWPELGVVLFQSIFFQQKTHRCRYYQWLYQLYSRWLLLVPKPQSISRYLTRFLYNASVSYVIARSTLDYGYGQFFPIDDLFWCLF
jgi:hypothetical protein